jgi:hypothetical protein
MARAPLSAPLVLVAAALIAAGCGSGSRASASHTSSTRSRTTTRRQTTPVAPSNPVPQRAPRPADARTAAVIRHWADALRRGDVTAAARYFEIPSLFAPGPDQEVTIHSRAQAKAVNAALPCGAEVISILRLSGGFVQALFRLTGRPGQGGSACSPGAGETARTNFVIRSGHIRVWVRAPDQPGDNQLPSSPDGSGGGGSSV